MFNAQHLKYSLFCLGLGLSPLSQATLVDEVLNTYRQNGAGPFSASAGEKFWQQDNVGKSCTQCHGNSPQLTGKHSQTGRSIEPMAPSVNPQRLTDSAKIEKWFNRNCKFTLGRECTAQEKGNVLVWLKGQ